MILDTNDYLTIAEVCKLWGVSRWTVYSYMRKGRAPTYVKINGGYLFDKKQSQAFTPAWKKIYATKPGNTAHAPR